MKPMDQLKAFAKKLKGDIKAIYIAVKYKKLPLAVKIVASITIVYALSPIDLIPDFIPVLGYLDDLIILPFLIALTLKLIPTEMISECRNEAEVLWKEGLPKKWYYSLLVIIIWTFVILLILQRVIN